MVTIAPRGWRKEHEREHTLGLAPVKRILQKNGMKVQAVAVEEFRIILEDLADEIQKRAAVNADYSGRRTIKPEDVVGAYWSIKNDFFEKKLLEQKEEGE